MIVIDVKTGKPIHEDMLAVLCNADFRDQSRIGTILAARATIHNG